MSLLFRNEEEEKAFEAGKDLALSCGFSEAALLDCSTIELSDAVRQMCEKNTCGMYAGNWACPPGCGSLEECRSRIGGYRWGILVQTVGELEDSLDYEGMMETEKRHKETFLKAAEMLKRQYPGLLALGVGCCTVCSSCSYPDAPCRFPDKQISSMESYGIMVSDLCRENGLGYYYGPGKIAYTSCYLLG